MNIYKHNIVAFSIYQESLELVVKNSQSMIADAPVQMKQNFPSLYDLHNTA